MHWAGSGRRLAHLSQREAQGVSNGRLERAEAQTQRAHTLQCDMIFRLHLSTSQTMPELRPTHKWTYAIVRP